MLYVKTESNFFPTLMKSWGMLVNVKDSLPAPKQCPDCQIGRHFSTRVKDHKGAVRRQVENLLLALHCLTTGHAFDWDRASAIGKGTT